MPKPKSLAERWATDVGFGTPAPPEIDPERDVQKRRQARTALEGELLAFDKDQKRGPDGRWIPEGGDWLDFGKLSPNDPGGQQVSRFMNEELPENVREGFKKRGVRVETRSGTLNRLPGIRDAHSKVDGVFFWGDQYGKKYERKAFIDTETVNRTHPPAFVVAHELGHAFDRTFDEANPLSPLSESREWNELVENDWENIDVWSAPTHNQEFFAHIFAAANGHSEGYPSATAHPRLIEWMRHKMAEME